MQQEPEVLTSSTADREIVISRILNAPRELVWQAFTDPKHLEKWWGPTGFTTTTKEFSFAIGGSWRHVMRGPDGTEYPNESIFEEIVPYERIAYSHGGGAEAGANDAQFDATITLEDLGEKTRVILHSVFPSQAARDFVVRKYGAIEGGNQTLARLAEYVENQH
jgi:uncharacterized protein YndB with AHSA1/START domain